MSPLSTNSGCPRKFDDPGMFTIPIQIGRFRFRKALLDLGASINVVPYQVYVDLDMGPMSKTDIEIQLADGSFVYPRGVVEDVLVQITRIGLSCGFLCYGHA